MMARSAGCTLASTVLASVVLLAATRGATAQYPLRQYSNGYDETPPAWGHAPTVTNLRPQTFDLRLSLDTTGYAYAVVVPTTATAPTAAEVKALTASGGASPVASGLVKVPAASTEVLLPFSTLKPVSTYAAVNTYSVYVVAEDDNRCPVCANPAVGCFEHCLTPCSSGECESRNIQGAVTSLPVTMPFPWQQTPVAYHASVLGEGHPAEWPQGWSNPITLTPTRLDPNDAPYKINPTGAGIRKLRRQLLAAFDNGTNALALAADNDGELSAAEEAEAERLVSARRTLLERRDKAGHTLVQWTIDVDFAEGVSEYDYNDGEVLGCFLSNFKQHSDRSYTATVTACDPCGSQSSNAKLETLSKQPIKYKSCTRARPGKDGGGFCQFRVAPNTYTFTPPVNICPVNYDAKGVEIKGGAAACAYTIPAKGSQLLSLAYDEFVGVCPYDYTEAHRNATSALDLDRTLESFVDSFNNASLPI